MDMIFSFIRWKKLENIFILKNTGMKGIPDRLILKNGVYIWIETKRPDETPSENEEDSQSGDGNTSEESFE